MVAITDVPVDRRARVSTGIDAFDRVLGGGLVVRSSVLISGDPGAGKSTLLAQMLAGARRPDGAPCERLLWVSAEETVAQIADRAVRIGAASPTIQVVRCSDVDDLLALASQVEPDVLVVDSVQTITCQDLNLGDALGQVRECARRVDDFVKASAHPTVAVLICQVNAEGRSAGPTQLKHLVDVLLSLDVDPDHAAYRHLRIPGKNRFGSVLETACFEMREDGLHPASPPVTDDEDDDEDGLVPVAQELYWRLVEAGVDVDAGIRDRLAGRIDLSPRVSAALAGPPAHATPRPAVPTGNHPGSRSEETLP